MRCGAASFGGARISICGCRFVTCPPLARRRPGSLDMARIGVSFAPFTGAGPMAVAFVFPGQGSQAVGMGKGLAETFAPARQVFEEVDTALGERLSEIIWNGPAETLMLTQNAQPAVMAVSLAAMRVLEAEAGLKLARDAAFVADPSGEPAHRPAHPLRGERNRAAARRARQRSRRA